MRSIKAIVIGSIFIFIVVVFLGLIYMFIAVGYIKLAANFQFLHDISGLFRYFIGIPVFMITMFSGGYLTAGIANMRTHISVWFHCLIVGLIAVGSMMYPALEYASLSLTGIIVIVLALSASTAGGFYWFRNQQIKENQ